MNIPLNGRIAIVDDKYKEVKPLINFLSKKRIPFNYYTGIKKTELPDDPDDNPITLMFLDLNIVETQYNPKVVISTLHPILKALCPAKSKPYLLVVWSKKLNDFADALETHFKKSRDLKGRHPVKFVRLNKSDFFILEDGDYVFVEDKYNELIRTLEYELAHMSVLKNFLAWENIVHHQAMKTVGEFSSFFAVDAGWDKNTKALLFHIAKAIVGNDGIQRANDETKLLVAFGAINSFLSDKIQNTVLSQKLGEISDVTDDKYDGRKDKEGRLKTDLRGKINSKLHITDSILKDAIEQGNVYKINTNNQLIKSIIDRDEYNNKIKAVDIFNSKPSLVLLDLTPVCDYSQDKKYTRFVHGVLIDAKFAGANINSAYQRQTPNFHIEKNHKFIVFDYRFITTSTKDEIVKKKMKPIFKLRREICTDIQSQLANQINRPGISNL